MQIKYGAIHLHVRIFVASVSNPACRMTEVSHSYQHRVCQAVVAKSLQLLLRGLQAHHNHQVEGKMTKRVAAAVPGCIKIFGEISVGHDPNTLVRGLILQRLNGHSLLHKLT